MLKMLNTQKRKTPIETSADTTVLRETPRIAGKLFRSKFFRTALLSLLLLTLVTVAGVRAKDAVDFSAPVITLRDLYAIQGEDIRADAFLIEVLDERMPEFLRFETRNADNARRAIVVPRADDARSETTDADGPRVFAYYETEPDVSVPGVRDVTVVVEDPHGNKTLGHAKLTVLRGNTSVTAEASLAPPIIALEDFFENPDGIDADFVVSPGALDFSSPDAIYDLPIRIEGRVAHCSLTVKDTTPPTATVRDQTVCTLDKPMADDFVSDITDLSPVSCEFVEPPALGKPGKQNVSIRLTDAFGNENTLTAALTVTADKKAPTISGVKNHSVLLHGSIGYRGGVSVTDDFDKNVKLIIDSSAVNLNAVGKYPVYYKASDASGNERTVTAYVSVMIADEASVYGKADEILAEITRDGMSDYEKARAIYNWVSSHVAYRSTGDKSGLLQGALNAFVLGRGDCYTYYAAGEVLLTRAGIANTGVTRIAGTPTEHYWSLVDVGYGWYHFDTCPAPIASLDKFMFTEKTAGEYTQRIGRNYYDYDREKYPAVVAE
jgi:hypothetical protein